MFGGNDATDKALLKTVNQKLSRSSGSQSRMMATVQGGTVTITGMVQYEAQRSPIIKQLSRISGVRRVVDQLTLRPKNVYPSGPPAKAATASPAEPAAAETPPAAPPADAV